MQVASGVQRREGLRLFRRLREPEYFLQQMADDPGIVGLFGPRNRWQKPVMKCESDIVQSLHRADLLTCRADESGARAHCGVGPIYVLSDAGHAWWQRQTSAGDAFQAQHQLRGQATIDEPGRGMVRHQVNLGESPLGWLRQRRGKKGRAYLTEAEADAGEQLRRDYTFARLDARTTLNWEGMLAHVDRSAIGATDRENLSTHAMDARKRVERALAEIGPGLADIAVETCCHLHGLEQSERALGWPQRSAKLVLKIALARLAHHYKITGGQQTRHGTYLWQASKDELPSLDQSE